MGGGGGGEGGWEGGGERERGSVSSIFALCIPFLFLFFMPPTSEKLREHIGLGLSVRPSVGQSVRLSATLRQLRNFRTAYARILKLYMWHVHEKLADPYFFSSTGLVVLDLCPFFDYV